MERAPHRSASSPRAIILLLLRPGLHAPGNGFGFNPGALLPLRRFDSCWECPAVSVLQNKLEFSVPVVFSVAQINTPREERR